MMKTVTLSLLTVLALTLAACGSASGAQQFGSGQSTNASTAELPMAAKLAVGSLKLEDTDFAVTSKQAAELLPLWQVYQDLSSSDTAAQEEVDALIEQIQETMTPDQMKAINGMDLTAQDVFTIMQQQGIQFAGGRQQSSQGNGGQNNGGGFSGRSQGGSSAFFQGGPGGGPEGGGPGGGFGGGQGLSPDQIATARANRGQNGGNAFVSRLATPVVEALIKLLQQKAGS